MKPDGQSPERIQPASRPRDDIPTVADNLWTLAFSLLIIGAVVATPWYLFGSLLGAWIVLTPMAATFCLVIVMAISALLFGWTGGKLSKPPGFIAHRYLSRMLTKRVYRSQFGELIEQARADHAEALAEGDRLQSKLVIIDLNVRVVGRLVAAVATLPIRVLAALFKIPLLK